MPSELAVESLRKRAVPDWFHDAKLGIFVHWGLYSVPGWAPLTGEYGEVIAKEGWTGWFARNPYAEWYWNSIRIKGSPSSQFHATTYGAEFPYHGFAPLFNEAIADGATRRRWNPDEWADLFQKAGACYVVLTAKHHDGFLLWPSHRPNPYQAGYFAGRDLVGELVQSVRARGLRMGLYYSGGLDWTFNDTVVRDIVDLLIAVPQGAEYVAYANGHWRELIERYEPSVLWNDIAYPAAANLQDLFAFYYGRVPDGVINDRFTQYRFGSSRLLRKRAVRSVLSYVVRWAVSRSQAAVPTGAHCDFRTPEYASFSRVAEQKWESTRGLGYSFGYNRNEGPEHCLSVAALVRLFVDIVSKNGNLLLNVGPMADGTIPAVQRERLMGLGQWLDTNGEGIFGTRPWIEAEGRTAEGTEVRFTHEENALYAILLGRPQQAQVTLALCPVDRGDGYIPNTTVWLLGHDEPLCWKPDGCRLTIAWPDDVPESPAYVLKITPQPHKIGRRQ
jgi:alpha-L-fucosidase